MRARARVGPGFLVHKLNGMVRSEIYILQKKKKRDLHGRDKRGVMRLPRCRSLTAGTGVQPPRGCLTWIEYET